VLDASAETQGSPRGFEDEPLGAEAAEQAGLVPAQAHEVAYRFLARYYDHERTAPIRRLLEAISCTRPAATPWAMCELWQLAIDETLNGFPLPELPPPWDP
jgi:hypothetical protein